MALGELADFDGGTVHALLREIEQHQEQVPISESTAKTVPEGDRFHVQALSLQFKKKRDQKAFEHASKVIDAIAELDQEQQCKLLYFDESGFSPNPPVQYGWGKIGQTRAVEPLAHRQRVNVLGALRYNGRLTWTTQQRLTTRNDVIAFFDQVADEPRDVPRIVLIDHAVYTRAVQ